MDSAGPYGCLSVSLDLLERKASVSLLINIKPAVHKTNVAVG